MMRTALLLLFVFVALHFSQAQIIFHDEPNTLHTGLFLLDMDNDGNEDFFIEVDNLGFLCYALPYYSSGNCIGGGTSLIYFNPGQSIGATNNWNCDSNGVTIETFNNFKYLGVKFNTSGQWYYGWLRIKTDNASFIIDSWAYNATAGEGLTAGQETTVGLNEYPYASFNLAYPNPATDWISLFPNRIFTENILKVTIADTQGKTVVRTTVKNDAPVIDIKGLHAGVYILTVSGNHQQMQTRFVKE